MDHVEERPWTTVQVAGVGQVLEAHFRVVLVVTLATSRVWIRLPQVWQLQEQWNSFIFAFDINCQFIKKAKCFGKVWGRCYSSGWLWCSLALVLVVGDNPHPRAQGKCVIWVTTVTFPRLFQVLLFKAAQMAGSAARWAHVESPGLDLNPGPWIHLI